MQARRTWRFAFAGAAVALALGVAPASRAATTDAGAAKHAADWVVSKQYSSGAFFTSSQSPQMAGETLAAIVAAGVKGTPISRALTYLNNHGKAGATEGAYTGRIIAGIVAGGGNPSDYVKILKSQYDAASGTYDKKNNFSNLMALNGLNAAKQAIPTEALAHLETTQCSDGGFHSFNPDCSSGSDTDATAWAINILVASGHKADQAVAKAHAWLVNAQKPDGGFGYQSAKPTSSDSTGLAISAVNALGEDPHAAPWKQSDGDDPVKALRKFQKSDGAFRATLSTDDTADNNFSTTNAMVGLSGNSYPVAPVTAQPTPSPTQRPSSGGGTHPANGIYTAAPYRGSSSSVQSGAAVATPQSASTGAGQSGDTRTARSDAHLKGKPRATPRLLGFGSIQTKPGGLSMAAWAAIAAACTGAGVGLWFLRIRLR